jgi:hypothetical protein
VIGVVASRRQKSVQIQLATSAAPNIKENSFVSHRPFLNLIYLNITKSAEPSGLAPARDAILFGFRLALDGWF